MQDLKEKRNQTKQPQDQYFSLSGNPTWKVLWEGHGVCPPFDSVSALLTEGPLRSDALPLVALFLGEKPISQDSEK